MHQGRLLAERQGKLTCNPGCRRQGQTTTTLCLRKRLEINRLRKSLSQELSGRSQQDLVRSELFPSCNLDLKLIKLLKLQSLWSERMSSLTLVFQPQGSALKPQTKKRGPNRRDRYVTAPNLLWFWARVHPPQSVTKGGQPLVRDKESQAPGHQTTEPESYLEAQWQTWLVNMIKIQTPIWQTQALNHTTMTQIWVWRCSREFWLELPEKSLAWCREKSLLVRNAITQNDFSGRRELQQLLSIGNWEKG